MALNPAALAFKPSPGPAGPLPVDAGQYASPLTAAGTSRNGQPTQRVTPTPPRPILCRFFRSPTGCPQAAGCRFVHGTYERSGAGQEPRADGFAALTSLPTPYCRGRGLGRTARAGQAPAAQARATGGRGSRARAGSGRPSARQAPADQLQVLGRRSVGLARSSPPSSGGCPLYAPSTLISSHLLYRLLPPRLCLRICPHPHPANDRRRARRQGDGQVWRPCCAGGGFRSRTAA
jgi:hypothetical protein